MLILSSVFNQLIIMRNDFRISADEKWLVSQVEFGAEIIKINIGYKSPAIT
jgi:hypothetical protein